MMFGGFHVLNYSINHYDDDDDDDDDDIKHNNKIANAILECVYKQLY